MTQIRHVILIRLICGWATRLSQSDSEKIRVFRVYARIVLFRFSLRLGD